MCLKGGRGAVFASLKNFIDAASAIEHRASRQEKTTKKGENRGEREQVRVEMRSSCLAYRLFTDT